MKARRFSAVALLVVSLLPPVCFAGPSTDRGAAYVTKLAPPEAGETLFAFISDLGPYDGFSLMNGQTMSFTDLVPGQYFVREQVPQGWNLESVVVVQTDESGDTSSWNASSANVLIDLRPGQSVHVYFTNEPVAPPVPSPAAVALGGMGLTFLGWLGRRRML